MTASAQDSDGAAVAYAQHWQPVLAPAVSWLLDHLEPHARTLAVAARNRRPRLVDIGTGTGQLALSGLERWPPLEAVGVDPDPGMLAVARRRAEENGLSSRLSFVEAKAEQLPFDDRSFDVAVSSFVIQLVDRRPAAFREIQRVLRPGGVFGTVTWLSPAPSFAPRDAVTAALADLDQEGPTQSGFTSPAALAAQLRRAGFRHLSAFADELVRTWSIEDYLAYVAEAGWRSTFKSLAPADRVVRLSAIHRALAELPASAFTWRRRTVIAIATRP